MQRDDTERLKETGASGECMTEMECLESLPGEVWCRSFWFYFTMEIMSHTYYSLLFFMNH